MRTVLTTFFEVLRRGLRRAIKALVWPQLTEDYVVATGKKKEELVNAGHSDALAPDNV